MTEDILNFGFQESKSSIIKVIGVGGGGCNAVNHMLEEGIEGVDFLICNTDAQALRNSKVPIRIQLGVTLTEGRGAGNLPLQGEQAAIENLDDIRSVLEGTTKMLFVTAGLGGGTGTGAAPVIAELARELQILTIAVVTIPSPAEGKRRFQQALEGVEKLKEHVDSLLVISNEKLHKIYGDLPASQAFKKADDILGTAVKGVAEIITLHGNINIDYADVETVMARSEVFIMGTGVAEGDERAMEAVVKALESPLLDSNDIKGTKDILLNITSGDEEVRMGEIGDIIEFLQKKAGQDANIIWGNGLDRRLGNKVSVTLIATRFDKNPNSLLQEEEPKEMVELQDQACDINLEDEEDEFFNKNYQPEMTQPEREDKNEKNKSSRKKQGKDKRELVSEQSQENGSTDSWFQRQFNRFFDDQDEEIEN
ncbi:cell division protein FtsZ [Sunxiuqinia elliptica]|uniref:Cell division protein FtsZ n=1 Tax=Sunxiuqinia elliptica TaxID=655355 RepID=A0A4R6HB17_9BACT|nr:cell division protein FtsZ [Sunxiuqinia elliptica]TDO04921.1 cell division protein FtsZ [Sunxiuqinia elliptica]TDO64469.1 cell division protein FtsZ [Sunxiuqinia elliptica]